MAKIPNDNPRFRSKDELCSDIAFVLNSRLKYGTKHAVLSEATWVWTEFEGKYKGCKHWSEAAWELKDQPKQLRHEHVVPKGIVIERLCSLQNPTADSVFELMERYCIGAVVTSTEDALLTEKGFRSKMPTDCDENDIWARYKSVGIVIRASAR